MPMITNTWSYSMLARIVFACGAFAFGALTLATVPMRAQEVEMGTILICDTQQHAERLVALVEEDAETALDALNEETENPEACVFADIEYEPDQAVSPIRVGSPPFEIIPIIATRDGMHSSARKRYFMLVPIDEVPA